MAFISFLMTLFILFIAYLVIRTAVQHGIEQSKTHELLQEIYEKITEKKEG